MGRYIGTPGSLTAEIENIVPVASRYSNRCLYTTPGSYTFTVPAGVTSINAVAVGPGGKPCTIVKCIVTTGRLTCVNGTMCVIKCNVTQTNCNLYLTACDPTTGSNTALTFETTRCLSTCTLRNSLCFNVFGDCDNIQSNYVSDDFNQVTVYSYFPSGPGGGYAEVTANTAAGCAYNVVVGSDCPAGGFSCVNGANVSICATGPKIRSCIDDYTTANSINYMFVGGQWRNFDIQDFLTTCTITTCNCTGATPTACIGILCKCGAVSNLCYCTVTQWCTLAEPGCGYGGTINRIGGWCEQVACTSLAGICGCSGCYPYGTTAFSPCFSCLYSVSAKCFGGITASNAGQAILCAKTQVFPTPSCCSSGFAVGFLHSISYPACIQSIQSAWTTGAAPACCCCVNVCTINNSCFSLVQQIRETGSTTLCVSNFSVNAPGNLNPYCAPGNGSLLCTSKYGFALCARKTHCLSYCYYCAAGSHLYPYSYSPHFTNFMINPSRATMPTTGCRTDLFPHHGNPFTMMNCCVAITGTCGGKYKFGGSSAGNYYRNGVSALNDDSTYNVCYNSRNQGGNSTYNPYTDVTPTCNFNNFCAIQSLATPAAVAYGCFNSCSGTFISSPFSMVLTCMCNASFGFCAFAGGFLGLSGYCCHYIFNNYIMSETCYNNYNPNCFCIASVCLRRQDRLGMKLSPGIYFGSSFEAETWSGYNDITLHWTANRVFNNIGAVGNTDVCICGSCYNYVDWGSAGRSTMCKDAHMFGGGTCCSIILAFTTYPARTSMKYFSTYTCCPLHSQHCSGPNVLLCVVPFASTCCEIKYNLSYYYQCNNSAQCHCTSYCCYKSGTHCYWPCCVCYNYCTTTCRVANLNGVINLYDYICSSPNDCGVTCAGIFTPYCHLQQVGSTTPFNIEGVLTSFYFPQSAAGTFCCVYKSHDQIAITDPLYNAQYVHGMCYYVCFNIPNAGVCLSGTNCPACITKQDVFMINNTCVNYNKTTGLNTCDLSSSANYAQGGAGIGTAGIWGDGTVSCTLLCSGGGNLKEVVPCCNIPLCWYDTGAAMMCTCTMSRALGWGLGPQQVQVVACDLTGCGYGINIEPEFTGRVCCSGMAAVIGGCSGNLPFNAMCYGGTYISNFLMQNLGVGYSPCTVLCSLIDMCTFTDLNLRCCGGYLFGAGGCSIFTSVGYWVACVSAFRCQCFTTSNGCTVSCLNPGIQPLFCAIVQPQFACYCCAVSTYSEGSGGGSKTGVAYCTKCANNIDSTSIISITPARGGRGNESPYEPYYFSYPGISARIAVPKSPDLYVGDPNTGCSWFDTPQINGSGGNGTFCSQNYSCIFVQPPGPGGGGANGTKSDGTINPNGGVLGGGAGCCGLGGYGGGSGWGVNSANTGMVVIYWN